MMSERVICELAASSINSGDSPNFCVIGPAAFGVFPSSNQRRLNGTMSG